MLLQEISFEFVVWAARYERLEPFQRSQGSGYFEVVGFNDLQDADKGDLFPPSAVTDLRVNTLFDVRLERRKRSDDDVIQIHLQWTAAEIHDNTPGQQALCLFVRRIYWCPTQSYAKLHY